MSPLYISVIFKHQSCPFFKIVEDLFHLRAGTKLAADLIPDEVLQAGSEVVLRLVLAAFSLVEVKRGSALIGSDN